jgi:hypothetical protein
MKKIWLAVGLIIASSAGQAQSPPRPGMVDLEAMLSKVLQNTYKLTGTCKRLLTPEGDQTRLCDPEVINLVLRSGNSSFIATTKGKGGISFRGKDSPAKGDVASLKVFMILLSGNGPTPAIEVKAKGQCTYTNPNKGPVNVECLAKTSKGAYQLSFVSDGVWPSK